MNGGQAKRHKVANGEVWCDGKKRCSCCEQYQSPANFTSDKRASDGLYGQCKDCVRDKNLRSRYNISSADYYRMLAKQGGGCAICGSMEPGFGRDNFAIDHNHSCCPDSAKSCGSCIRGLLCFGCNAALGHFGDSIDQLERAADYLRAESSR